MPKKSFSSISDRSRKALMRKAVSCLLLFPYYYLFRVISVLSALTYTKNKYNLSFTELTNKGPIQHGTLNTYHIVMTSLVPVTSMGLMCLKLDISLSTWLN